MTIPAMVTTFATAVSGAVERVVAMQQVVVPNTQADDYASFEYPYSMLYWRNQPGSYRPQGVAVNEFRFDVPITADLIVGTTQQGYDGALETLLFWTYVPRVLAYFTSLRDLQYTTGLTELRFFEDAGLTIGFSGVITPTLSDGAKGLGARFSIVLPFRVPLNRSVT